MPSSGGRINHAVETTDDTLNTATTFGARDHARSQAGTQVRGMPTIPATDAVGLPGAATAIWEETIEPGEYAAHLLPRGALLRLVIGRIRNLSASMTVSSSVPGSISGGWYMP
jgi:hypothetical protein